MVLLPQLSHIAFLLLGSNQGDKKNYLEQAVSLISTTCGEIVTQSAYYFSESWGYEDADYLNRAISISTRLSPEALLCKTQSIERQLGRISKTTEQYQARTIDIDILFYDALIKNTEKLTIPHPRLHLRNFVLKPLEEIAPHFVHPILQKPITELTQKCPDTGKVWR